MKIDINGNKNLLAEHGVGIEGVLRRAVRQALAEHKRAQNKVASWADGRVVLIEPDDIHIGDVTAQERI